MEVKEMEKKNGMDYAEACNFVKQYIKKTKKSQAQVASEIGFSSSALSGFLSGTYSAPHTIITAIENLAEVNKQREVAPKKPEFQETGVVTAVTQAIRYCHLLGNITVAYGDAGVGKTVAVERYLAANPLAIGIDLTPTDASITGVNELIAEQLGIREKVERRQTRAIVDKLRGSGRVIIVDEAQFLTTRTIDHLRRMSDRSGVGVCFVGNDKLNSSINGNGSSDFSQLFSRRGMNPEVRVSDITKEEIEKIFGSYVPDPDAIEMLYRISHTNFGLRGAVNVFINTAATFGEVNAEGLARAARTMKIR